ncbi:MAG: GNAT family N-acetyltransferase [Clostridia bacterium]|nr:GNAT family N-acetyltransferase [Clostridia bacterium]
MNIDIAVPDDRARMISDIGNMIQSSLDERSIAQHAEMILDEYIVRTNHHIWLVSQCAKILRDIIISRGQDIEMFDTNVEFHDYDKTHNDEILPVYALACHYFYFHNKDVKYKVDEDWLDHEFEHNAWPKHHKANKHHYAEHYGKKNDKGVLEVPETYDILNLVEMYADWMAMGITNGGTAHDWWTKNYGPDNKFDFHGRDLGIIQECILAEDKAVNQLAYLRQFKDVEPTWVPPMEIETHDEVDPLTTKEVNEGIENFFNYESNETLSLKRDDLYIGPIDPMIIDPEKMMKLAEYPELLLALKKWTTMPDFNLAPQLTMLGKIVDDLYKFKNPITCYRGIRTGFDSRSNKKQNLMGVIDNDIAYLRLLKPGFDKAGTTFEYETQEPMSVARSPYIAKIYGNFIIKTEVPADANKLVITPELSYLLQQMEVEYPEYRAVNLSITHEVVVFTGTKLTFEIVSVYGDISSELETMKEHSFEGLGNTKMNGVYFNIFETNQKDTSTEALLAFKNTGVDKQITDLARPCYKPTGQNSWEHIQQVYSQASRICKKIYNRDLTRAEYAAILFHDCSVIDSGKESHNVLSAEKAIKMLSHTPFTDIERDQIYNAIVEHDNQDTSGQWVFSSPVSELVAAGDFNPPDAEWIMNKSYTWGITHGLDHAGRIENMVSLIKRAYSTNGEMWLHMPDAYKKYFATKINAVKKLFDKITPEEAEKIVMAYRKKHHLSETDTNLPTSSVEALSDKESDVSISKYNGSKEELEIIRQCVNLSARSINPKDEGYDKTTFEKLVNNKDKGPYWIIRNGNDIIGSVSIRSSTVGADEVYKCSAINDFAILEKYQGKGLGKKALLAIIDYIRKTMKYKDIGLGVGENNTKAISLYKSVGFKRICGASWGEGDQKFIGHQMLLKYEESSNEALSPDVKKKKQLIIDYICSVCDIMDPSKLNSKRYHRLLDSMSDKEFDQWMNYVKEGKWKIHIVAPNLVVTLKNENSLKAADKVKCKLFHRLWMTDDSTGRQYLTDNEYLVLNLPVRRQQQFLDEKMSVPDNDKQIDGLTGQVTGDSKSSAVTNPEIQILAARGLDATLEEFVNVRGGNIAAYSDFKRQAEETGEIKLNSLDQNTRSRVAVVGQVLLRSMMIENNIVE